MIKFLHAADLHLDSSFAALQPSQAARRREEQRQLVTQLRDLCVQEACQLMFLSGDLFDGQTIYRDTLDALRDALSECPARVFIAPGNHDPIHSTSPYLTQAWPENVHIFTSAAPQAVPLEELGCVVYGAAFTAAVMPPMLRDFRAAQEPISFMVLHGDAQLPNSTYNAISRAEIAESGLDYLALGHIHRRSELCRVGATHYAWPGCPMGRGFDETGEKGVFIGQAEKGNLRLEFRPLDVRRYAWLHIEAGHDPFNRILEQLPEDTARHIYRITLTGESESVDLSALYAALEDRFYSLQLRDETVPPLELWTRSGEDTLEGMALHTLHDALARCESAEQRRRIELAARRIVEVCEGREAPPL